MTRWLITGAGGMLGRDLRAVLGTDATGLDRAGLDVTDRAAVHLAIRDHRPDVVVNCAAWTDVDDAEAHEDAALAVNGGGAALLASACAQAGVRLVQVSTDYVFDGPTSEPWPEGAEPRPRTAYGRTKLTGERAVLDTLPGAYVVRTAWLYGARGRNFVATMLRLACGPGPVHAVNDQHGQPTWTADVARQIVALVVSGAPGGIYHATSSGQATRYELAREVFRLAGADPSRVRPVPAARFPSQAPRPAWSVLGHDAWHQAGLAPIRDWRASLGAAFPVLRVTMGVQS